ncbi:MAG: branched-chain amino acid ABC transporter permease [Alphaproteobacteria bacterium]
MDYFLILLGTGLVVGSAYGMTAMGFAMIYKATGVINFAQGEIMMVIAYVAYSLTGALGLSFFPLMAITIPLAMLIGLGIERVFIRPMLGEPVFSTVMVTVGLAVIIRGIVIMIWGTNPFEFRPGFSNDVIRIGPVPFYEVQLYAIGSMAFLVLAMFLFFRYSRMGIAMRATANNETAALLMGISVKRVYAVAWALAATIAAVSGVLFGAMFTLGPDMWFQGLKSFPAVILGGLDSVLGSALAGLIIGIIENFATGYVGQGLKEITGFVVIILVLMVWPYGMFGARKIERV